MAKTITSGNKIEAAIRSIRVKNDNAISSVKVNKQRLFTWVRRIATIGLSIGYVIMTILSYSVSPVYFWTLVKAGIILSLLLIIAFGRKN